MLYCIVNQENYTNENKKIITNVVGRLYVNIPVRMCKP